MLEVHRPRRKGVCWDNAPMESFFGKLKTELVHHKDYRTRKEAKRDIFDYIEVFYNRQRRHSSLGYLSPAEFESKENVATVCQRKQGKLNSHVLALYYPSCLLGRF